MQRWARSRKSVITGLTCGLFLYAMAAESQHIGEVLRFDSKLAINNERTIAVTERIEVSNGGLFDQGFHRRLPIKPINPNRPKEGSFEAIQGKVDGQDAKITVVRQDDWLEIQISTEPLPMGRGNHTIDLSYTATNQFTVYRNFEDLNISTGVWTVPVLKGTVELHFPSGMPPRATISADTGSDSSFQFDCVRTELPSGTRFETSRPLSAGERLFISARFAGGNYFASANERRTGIVAVVVNHPLLSLLTAGLIVLSAVSYFAAAKSEPTYAAAPRWIHIAIVVALPGTAALALRLTYEQTVMTWRYGEQMVGYSMSHAYVFLFIPMMLSSLVAHIALLSVVSVTVGRRLRGLPIPKWKWWPILVLLLCSGLLYVPYEVWMATTTRLAGPGPHGERNLMIAAADGKLGLARALIEHGVSPNAMGGGSTALEVACSSRNIEVAKFLITSGADLNRAPTCSLISELRSR